MASVKPAAAFCFLPAASTATCAMVTTFGVAPPKKKPVLGLLLDEAVLVAVEAYISSKREHPSRTSFQLGIGVRRLLKRS